jgi:hypothetical protein
MYTLNFLAERGKTDFVVGGIGREEYFGCLGTLHYCSVYAILAIAAAIGLGIKCWIIHGQGSCPLVYCPCILLT